MSNLHSCSQLCECPNRTYEVAFAFGPNLDLKRQFLVCSADLACCFTYVLWACHGGPREAGSPLITWKIRFSYQRERPFSQVWAPSGWKPLNWIDGHEQLNFSRQLKRWKFWTGTFSKPKASEAFSSSRVTSVR